MNALDELRATLEARSGGFSPSEGRLAADLIEHPDQWGYQPSTVLAERVGVHRSTIVRFAQRAGFEGYPEMQRAVREAYLSSMAAAPELVLTDTTPAEGAVVSAVFQRELSNLQQSYRSLSLDTLERTAEGLAGAERVIVFGRRFSHPIAQYLSLALRTMRPGVDVAPDPGGTSIDRLFDLGAQDYALVVSLRRYSPEVQRVLRHLHEGGVPHTVLTDTSPAADVPDGARVLRANVGSTGVLDSYTAITSLGHVLLTLVAGAVPGAEARLAQVERAWRAFSMD